MNEFKTKIKREFIFETDYSKSQFDLKNYSNLLAFLEFIIRFELLIYNNMIRNC